MVKDFPLEYWKLEQRNVCIQQKRWDLTFDRTKSKTILYVWAIASKLEGVLSVSVAWTQIDESRRLTWWLLNRSEVNSWSISDD